jgi:hypothetical protein
MFSRLPDWLSRGEGFWQSRMLGLMGSHPCVSCTWLAPQQILMGLCQVFNTVALIEFYNDQFPENMRSIGTSLFYLSSAGASYMSSLVMNVVHNLTGKNGRPDWLTNDINVGRLDYFYFLITGLAVLNFVYFLFCAHQYRYKAIVKVQADPV